VPSELGYGYFCGNVVGEHDAWVSSYRHVVISHFYVRLPPLMMMLCIESFSAAYKKVRLGDVRGSRRIS
jgi:hypothetical protein